MSNKLLLIDDVESLGRSGEIVSVRPGYARNFLLPKGLAVVASASTIRKQAKLQEERKKRAEVERKEAEEIAAKLENLVLETLVKVDHDGHMYGSVTAQDVQHLIEKTTGIHVEKRAIQLKQAIKATGTHAIHLKLKEGVVVESIKLNVVSEEAGVVTPQPEQNKQG